MLQLAVSGIKTVALVAAVIPGVEALTNALDGAAEGNEIFTGLLNALSAINDAIANFAAEIGNHLGLDFLAGVGDNKLTSADFQNGFGILPKILGNVSTLIPGAIAEATKNPTPVIVGGAAVLGLTALDPSLATSLNQEGGKVANTIVNVARQASQTAEQAAQFTTGIISQKPSASVQPTASALTDGNKIIGPQTANLSAQMEAKSANQGIASAAI